MFALAGALSFLSGLSFTDASFFDALSSLSCSDCALHVVLSRTLCAVLSRSVLLWSRRKTIGNHLWGCIKCPPHKDKDTRVVVPLGGLCHFIAWFWPPCFGSAQSPDETRRPWRGRVDKPFPSFPPLKRAAWRKVGKPPGAPGTAHRNDDKHM